MRVVGAAAAVAALLALTGCSTSASTQPLHLKRTFQGTAVTQTGSASSDARPTVYWIDGRQDIALSAYGSSSCPPVPESLTVASPNRVTVHLRHYDTPCTADLAPTTSELNLPGAVSRRRTVNVTLSARDTTATTLRLRPNPVVPSRRG